MWIGMLIGSVHDNDSLSLSLSRVSIVRAFIGFSVDEGNQSGQSISTSTATITPPWRGERMNERVGGVIKKTLE